MKIIRTVCGLLLSFEVGCSQKELPKGMKSIPNDGAATITAMDPLFSGLVDHASSPSREILERDKLWRWKIAGSVENLTDLIRSRLTTEFLPPCTLASITDGIRDYDAEGDYLFAEYVTRGGHRVSIQDGVFLYMLIEPPAGMLGTNLEKHVRDLALASISYPTGLVSDVRPRVGTSSRGASTGQVGNVLWIIESDPDMRESWYDAVGWWSNGSNVLFRIVKTTEAEYERIRDMAHRPDVIKVRKFSEEERLRWP